jgi:carbon storage regulator CsrA
MLVLSRQRGETVMIGDQVDVTVIDVRGEKVRLGINAPRDVAVHRKEIYEQIKENNRQAAGMKELPKAGEKPVAQAIGSGPARPETSGMFQVWTDAKAAVESYILQTRVAPVQQSFAAGNCPMSADGRYLWFYCAFPPGGDAEYGRTLGVVDFLDQDVRHFPETQFGASSPYVDSHTGYAYWCTGAEIYRRSPFRSGQAERVARFEAAVGTAGASISSRLTRSADGKWFSMDAHFEDAWHVGAVAVEGGAVELWATFDEPVTAEFDESDPEVLIARGEGKAWEVRRGGRKEISPAKREEIVVVREMPKVGMEQYDPRPNAQVCNGKYVVYTTTVLGKVDVAVALAERVMRAT